MSSTPRPQSDSEDDEDYVPPAQEDLSEESEGEKRPKRQRIQSPQPTAEEVGEDKKHRAALWNNFQASVTSSSSQDRGQTERKTVKLQKRYLFAGEYISEIVEVPEDSPEAKRWPLYQEFEVEANLESSATPELEIRRDAAQPSSTPTSSTDLAAHSKPPLKKLGPRKSKVVLGALPSASSQKAKKLTTLDKSLMDWKAHTQDTPLQDELDANRKSGGYLEKVEFLQRVEQRKEENLEASKGRKKRKL